MDKIAGIDLLQSRTSLIGNEAYLPPLLVIKQCLPDVKLLGHKNIGGWADCLTPNILAYIYEILHIANKCTTTMVNYRLGESHGCFFRNNKNNKKLLNHIRP